MPIYKIQVFLETKKRVFIQHFEFLWADFQGGIILIAYLYWVENAWKFNFLEFFLLQISVQYSVCYFIWQDTQSYIDECPGNGVRKKIHKDLTCNWGQFGWYRQLALRAAFFIIWWQPRILSKSKSSQELLFIWKVCLVITLLKINILLILMSLPLFFPHRYVTAKWEAAVLWWLV